MIFNININCIYKTRIDNIDFKFKDSIVSRIVKSVSKEINQGTFYDFKDMNLHSGDTVVDIGANIGIVSIYLAKKFPNIKIYAYEPVAQNYKNFLENIKLNNIPDGIIIAKNKAVTSDGRNVSMKINVLNSGGSSLDTIVASGYKNEIRNTNVESTTLTDIFLDNNITNLKLLKIDCEGAEYEILNNTQPSLLNKIEILRGEFHENKTLTDEYDAEKLLNYTKQHINDCKVLISKDCFIM